MLTEEFEHYEHHAKYIDDADIEHAFWYLVAFGAHSQKYDCKIYQAPSGEGKRSFRFHNADKKYPLSFLINRKHLSFYFRKPFFDERRLSIQSVKDHFGDLAYLSPNSNEVQIRVESVDGAHRVTEFLMR
jgi:hypothetical protein